MRCIHIYRGAPQLGGIKLHKHFSWFHTAKWGVHRIAPRTVLHVIRIVLTMELQPLKTVELHGWVCLPDSLVRNGSTSPIHTDYKRTHTHNGTHTRTHMTHTHTHTHTHTRNLKVQSLGEGVGGPPHPPHSYRIRGYLLCSFPITWTPYLGKQK